MFWLFVAGGILVATCLLLFLIGARIHRPPYPDAPGPELDDEFPGLAHQVVWPEHHPDVAGAKIAFGRLRNVIDAGALALVEGGGECFAEYSRPVAIALIMEALSPIVTPTETRVFVRWYSAMALLFHIDDRITDPGLFGSRFWNPRRGAACRPP